MRIDNSVLIVSIQVLKGEEEILELGQRNVLLLPTSIQEETSSPILESTFEAQLRAQEYAPTIKLTHTLSADFPLSKWANTEVEVIVTCTLIDEFVTQHKRLEEQLLSTQEHQLRLMIEKQKWEEERRTQERTFTERIKELESSATTQVQSAIQENRNKLIERFNNERRELQMYAGQPFFTDFLAQFLTLERVVTAGLAAADATLQNYVRGFELVVNNMLAILQEYGIERILPNVGDQFDANLQSADSIVADKKVADGTIVSVTSHGYRLYDRLIVPASVVVNRLSRSK